MAALRIIIEKLMARCSSMACGGTGKGLWPPQRPSLEFRKFTVSPPCPHPRAAGDLLTLKASLVHRRLLDLDAKLAGPSHEGDL